MKKALPLILLLNILFTSYTFAQQGNGTIKKSLVLFTQPSGETEANYGHFNADGLHWGFMLGQGITNDNQMNNWAQGVQNQRSKGRYFFGRGEFDWGWRWMIDYMGNDVNDYWAKDLNGNKIDWSTATHKGINHGWQSHQGPLFLDFMKYQVDRLTLAPVSHMMFDSQTSATRTLHWKGGDFSAPSMNAFREYMRNKYTNQELSNLGINNINTFNYRQFLLNRGVTLNTYRAQANRINGNIPLYEDFVYFQRQALNDLMDEVFDYVDTKRPGIPIGATTNLVEPRGYLFSDRLTYLAGEFPHDSDPETSPPTQMVLHYKLAEDLDKTLIFFPYPDAFNAIRSRNAPRQSRGWIAQSYAMGSIFTIPGRVWTNSGNGAWDMGHENHADLYNFVKDHAELFDDYEAVSNVALNYSVYASLLVTGQNGSPRARATLDALIRDNISFDMKIFGDPDQPLMPSSAELGAYEVIVQDSDAQYFTGAQKQRVASHSDKVVTFNANNLGNIRSRLSWKLDVLQNGTIRNGLISALPRASTVSEAAPYVIHLINRKYDRANDNATTHNNITVKVPTAMFEGDITSAKLHIPGQASVHLVLNTSVPGQITLDIGTFSSCWGMLELIHEPAGDQVTIINKPTELISDTTYTFQVQYTATVDRDVVVSVFNEGQWIDGITTEVSAGTSILDVVFDFDTPLPVGDNYEIRAMIREVDGDFTTNKDIDQATPVRVVYQEDVTLLDPPTQLLSSNRYVFDVSYAANETADLVLALFDGATWVGGTTTTVAAGMGTESVAVELNAPLAAGTDYEIRAMIREVGGDFSTNMDMDRVLGVEVSVITSLDLEGPSQGIELYPNPVKDLLFVKGLPEEGNWNLYNSQGMKLLSGGEPEINLSQYAPGMYFLEFSDGLKVKVIRR